MAAKTFRLFVDRLEFYAYHGASDQEQFLGHRYMLSLDAKVAGKAPITDDLNDTLDYGALSDLAVRVALSAQSRLMEFVVREIAKSAFDTFPQLRVLTVTLAKVAPPIPHVAAQAGVAITFTREDFA